MRMGERIEGEGEQVYRRAERKRKKECFVLELDLEFGFVLLGAKPGPLSLSLPV